MPPRILSRDECVTLHRCPDCEWHVKTQGHHPECPRRGEPE